jgi:hypothetical protein
MPFLEVVVLSVQSQVPGQTLTSSAQVFFLSVVSVTPQDRPLRLASVTCFPATFQATFEALVPLTYVDLLHSSTALQILAF